ncbi:sigma-70 family RNA polymerase sigma factor [Humisphaera borealis]|uniref:Sigma-70 family RNA polymerase sigma factor n=1 Tax=Humisphaera borealis TaxID=2807512 RepID=A0A7M2WQF9_9BACT|nr:sigma-70 family RNA polymerase sigma factor [Humisphaera borealis]QOV87629.1 sigma-70 family RNA polymerase sigma factor [Humisphaera borealis]
MPSPTPEPDHADFLRLYAEHQGALQTFVRSLLCSREEAAEVMQEVLIVLWQKFDQVQEFRPWAFGVARNMVLRHLRARKQDRHVFGEDLVNQLADDAANLVERHAGHREALQECLNKLPAAQRQLVLTAYTKGTRIDDLATRRGQTPMSLYKVLHRIRQALLECVQRTVAKGEPA